jgi:hypothetical protein
MRLEITEIRVAAAAAAAVLLLGWDGRVRYESGAQCDCVDGMTRRLLDPRHEPCVCQWQLRLRISLRRVAFDSRARGAHGPVESASQEGQRASERGSTASSDSTTKHPKQHARRRPSTVATSYLLARETSRHSTAPRAGALAEDRTQTRRWTFWSLALERTTSRL